MQVLSYDECAKRAGFTRRTLERQIAEGRGPAIVELSQRRRGVFEHDLDAWLLARRKPTIGEKRGRGRPRNVEVAAQ